MTSSARNVILAVALIALFVLVVALYGQNPKASRVAEQVEADYPFSFTDDAGREITVEEAPVRIVSLDPSLTEILFHLGVGERVMAVDDGSEHPSGVNAIAKIGDGLSPDVAAVGNAVPQLILATSEPFQPELLLSHAALVVLEMASLEDMYTSVGIIGRISGISSDAESAISSMRARQSSLQRRVEGKEPVSVYIELSPSRRGVSEEVEFISEVMDLAGAAAVLPGDGVAYGPERLDIIEALDPDFMLILDPSLSPSSLLSRAGWAEFVEQTQVQLVTADDVDVSTILKPGPRSLDGIERLIEYFHPKGKGLPQ